MARIQKNAKLAFHKKDIMFILLKITIKLLRNGH